MKTTPARVDLRRLGPEHVAAIELIRRKLGCRTATEAIRLALLSTAAELYGDARGAIEVRRRAAVAGGRS